MRILLFLVQNRLYLIYFCKFLIFQPNRFLYLSECIAFLFGSTFHQFRIVRKDRKSTRLKLQSRPHLVCRLLLEKKKKTIKGKVKKEINKVTLSNIARQP